MKKDLLSEDSISRISTLLANEVLRKKVLSAGEEGRTFNHIRVSSSGVITLGETSVWWWNRLAKCQFPLTFLQFASAIWSGLKALSAGGNKEAIEEGLSTEIMKHVDNKDYDWVVKRLQEVYDHFCNDKGGAGVEAPREKSGPSVAGIVKEVTSPVNVNVNIDGQTHKTMLFPDATGRAFLKCNVGITGVETVITKD